ncbi:MAG: DUF2191 domain-containing protein [Acidobacteria bacterium]|nr:DUF2191 domain-containing protein [Acidobacteriota bacterium]
MKTTVEIADPLFDQVKVLAKEEGVSFRDLVEEGLRSVVSARSSAAGTPFRLRDGSFAGGGGLQGGLSLSELTRRAYADEKEWQGR